MNILTEYNEERHMRTIRREGREECRKEILEILKLHAAGETVETIAACCNLPLGEVQDTLRCFWEHNF